ncbi:MAG: hypothetical protein D6730_14875 [Bacteroidetes bacterium]|nr:MAG: hypothetical protein D6730_14875 [Bacteroidota bacterium]
MKRQPITHLLLISILGLMMSACQKGNVEMDNAGDQTLEVTVDELTYTMKPGDYQKLELKPGTHRIIIKDEDGKTIEEATFQVKEGGLLNLARKDYYIWTDLYGDPSLKAEKLKEDWHKIGDKSYYGEFTRIEPENIYVEKTWDYGLEEDFPTDLIGLQLTREKYMIKSKLFREKDLIEAYNALARQSSQ